jgi:hypothetical protein
MECLAEIEDRHITLRARNVPINPADGYGFWPVGAADLPQVERSTAPRAPVEDLCMAGPGRSTLGRRLRESIEPPEA